MNVLPTEIRDVLVLEPKVWRDGRGWFVETFHAARYRDAGIAGPFVQDNRSHSTKGTLRGLHAQRKRPQGKLVQVVAGEIFDVAVDIRPASPTFLKWVGVTLSAENGRQCWVPPGFAHGFCVLSETADVEYKCTDTYDAADEMRIQWNDPEIGIRWPDAHPVLSEKDCVAKPAREVLAVPARPIS